jgi:uncharacterized heparinase superfamily protein
MTVQTVFGRIERAAIGIAHSRRRAGARLRGLSWQHRVPRIDELLICPIDVRTPDPGFADELAAGYVGLAGAVLDLNGRSPFSHAAPSAAFAHALHGFEWLRHLDAVRTVEAEQLARAHVRAWIARYGQQRNGLAWRPGLAARRLTSWLAHAPLIVADDDEESYDTVLRAIGRHLAYLSRTWKGEPVAEQRAVALIAVVTGHLCRRGGELHARRAAGWLTAELGRQILPDGGHVTRNPEAALEILLDLFVLKQCYAERGLEMPPPIAGTMKKLLGFLQLVRLGDGNLCSFNGATFAARDSLATIDSLVHGERPLAAAAPQSKYHRMERGGTIIIVDAGPAPELAHSAAATASCLAFDMSTDGHLLVSGSYRPSGPDSADLYRARGTTSYTTLALDDAGYAELVTGPIESIIGGPGLAGPGHAEGALTDSDGTLTFAGTHDGYVPRHQLRHARTLELGADGRILRGAETLEAAGDGAAPAHPVPFSVHFHAAPDSTVRFNTASDAVEIRLPHGAIWHLASADALISIEDSRIHAHPAGPVATHQIVLRGTATPGKKISWTLLEAAAGSEATVPIAAAPRRKLSERLAEAIAEVNAAQSADDGAET